jgi:GrpB-like predicted nucleotidyltransferase (UPF0157 family)
MKNDLIDIVPYKDVWKKQFLRAKDDIKGILGDICLTIEHIGSTSVLNLASKDRIDIQIGVKEISAELCEVINIRVCENGFPKALLSIDHLPPNEVNEQEWTKIYLSGINEQWDFRANIHIRKIGAKNYNYALLFRDYLRNHHESAVAYARLKQALAEHTRGDRDAYCKIKDPVCDLIMINARNWARSQN